MLSEHDKKELKQQIHSNKHEIFVVSFEEMEAIIHSSPNGNKPKVQNAWQQIKVKAGVGVSYYASADDAVTMSKLVSDLGGFGARAYIKTYGGNPHIILKGHPGLRKILTGTKYGIKNPKVVSIGLGKAGAVTAAKQGGILTIFLLSTYRVIDYVLTDEATLTQLIGTLATDIVKVGIATGASIAAATFIAGITTIAIGPILAVVFVGVAGTYILDNIDQQYAITERIIAGLDEIEENAQDYIKEKKQSIFQTAAEATNSVIDHAIDYAQQIAIKWVQDQISQYLYPHRIRIR